MCNRHSKTTPQKPILQEKNNMCNIFKFFAKNVKNILNNINMFGIIHTAIEMAEDGGQVAREKPIFWLNSQCFEHCNLGN